MSCWKIVILETGSQPSPDLLPSALTVSFLVYTYRRLRKRFFRQDQKNVRGGVQARGAGVWWLVLSFACSHSSSGTTMAHREGGSLRPPPHLPVLSWPCPLGCPLGWDGEIQGIYAMPALVSSPRLHR